MLKLGLVNELYKTTQGSIIEYDFPESQETVLHAVKNSRASFQLLLQSDEEFLLTTTSNPVFWQGGPKKIIRSEVAVAGLNAQQNIVGMMEDDDRSFRADPLLHQETILVPAWQKQAVWIDAAIPENLPSGEYQGQLRLFSHEMFEDEVLAGELSFTIVVHEVTLPNPTERTFYLDLWQHCANIARKHEVVLWSDDHFQILESYVESLAQLGQKAISVIVSEIPWSGQRSFQDVPSDSDLYEYSMVRITRDKAGKFHYDFSLMDRYIELCFQHGIDEEIEVFGLCNIWLGPEAGFHAFPHLIDDIRLRYFDEETGSYRFIRELAEIEAYIQALEEHFAQQELLSKVRIVADEPADTEIYKKRLAWLRETAPRFYYKAAINHIEFLKEQPPRLLDYVPMFPFLCDYADELPQLREGIEGKFLYYVCCGPERPNTFIRSPLAESRLIPILAKFMGLDGFLRWNYTVWPDKPREQIIYRPSFFPAGDTNFVYPANSGKVMLSLRYKALDRGIEDFELLELVQKECTDWEEIHNQYFSLILREQDLKLHHPDKYKKDPADLYSLEETDYEKARLLLIEALEK